MSREIWEQVQVYNVNVGDVIMINTYGHPLTIAEGQIDKYGGIALSGYQIHSHDTVFRRIPDTEDPRVLRRALEMTSAQVFSAVRAMMDRGGPHPTRENIEHYVQSAIEKARRELESEGGK